MISNIAVPVDGSRYSFKAVDYAIEIASNFNASLSLIHVLDESSIVSYDAQDLRGNEILDKVSVMAKDKGVLISEYLITGDALRDMRTIIIKSKADLVVIHRFGSDLFSEDLNLNQIGSVASRVLNTVDIPVLLVK